MVTIESIITRHCIYPHSTIRINDCRTFSNRGAKAALIIRRCSYFAYVFIYILPTLHKKQEEFGGSLALDTELYFLGLLGLLVYFSVIFIRSNEGSHTPNRTDRLYGTGEFLYGLFFYHFLC